MRAPPAKFLFNDDFGARSNAKPTIGLAEHADRVREAEAAAYARGFTQAQAEAKSDATARSTAALERVAAVLATLDRSLGGVEAKLETEAVEVAVAVARKLAPELTAREPLAELAALATDCFRHLVKTPHVVVRVNEQHHETACKALEETVRRCGLESRLVVLAEAEIAPGDCRIEWADGGVTRDSAAVAATIEEAVNRYIEARMSSATMQGVAWRQER
jgi:flagellar assembly protein FliH